MCYHHRAVGNFEREVSLYCKIMQGATSLSKKVIEGVGLLND